MTGTHARWNNDGIPWQAYTTAQNYFTRINGEINVQAAGTDVALMSWLANEVSGGGLTYGVENEHLAEEMHNFMITVAGEAVEYRRVRLMMRAAQNM